jgi:type VI secretion system protein ImpH
VGTEVGRADPSLTELLFQCPYEFDFFQAVRLLGLIYSDEPLLPGLGEGATDAIRFQALPSLSFPPSAIHSIREGDPLRMTVAFMGLTGPLGVLPAHYTEFLIARLFQKDAAAAAFFDLFNHRFIALFYQAWAKHNLAAAYEREQVPQSKRHGITQYLFDLIGLGTEGLRGRLLVPDEALLLYAGLIAQRPHSASALRAMLEDYFRVPVNIQQFAGKWVALTETDLSYLSPDGLHNQLGFGAIAGDQVWNQQAGFVVQLGPLTYERFVHFLPNGEAFSKLVNLVRFFVGQAFDFDVQLFLRSDEVPWCKLSDDLHSPRLGWSTWLKTEEFSSDARDTVLAAIN